MTENNLNPQTMQMLEIKEEGREQLLQKLSQNYLSTGKYAKNQVSISPTIMSSLIAASGAGLTALSACFSSTLFMATENPAMLMQLSSGGVGSAVMSGGRIVKQAGFIPIASSLPIVAPMIAMQVMSTIAIMKQFKVVNQKLETIQKEMDQILLRQEVTSIAGLLSAINVVDELYDQHSTLGHFSQDMLIRLALVERDSEKLKARYEMLDSINADTASTYKNSDAYFTLLSNLLLLRIKYLRLCVDTQENPEYAKYSMDNFQNTLEHTLFIYGNFRKRSQMIAQKIKELEVSSNKKDPLSQIKNIKSDNKLSIIKEEYISMLEIENQINVDFGSAVHEMKKLQKIDNKNNQEASLLYWQDDTGAHCIATDEDLLSLAE